MSRIGNKPVVIPEKVEVSIKDMSISVKGPKGELSTTIIDERIVFEIKENVLTFSRTSEDKVVKSLHGLYRSLVANNIEGVVDGLSKTLTLVGGCHKVSMKGNEL